MSKITLLRMGIGEAFLSSVRIVFLGNEIGKKSAICI